MPNLPKPKPLPTVQERSLTIDGPYKRPTPLIVWPVALVAVVISVMIGLHAFATYLK